jgi:hypothetical protein
MRHVLHCLLEAHSRGFEADLCVMLSRISLERDCLEALFRAPFQFTTDELFSTVIQSLHLPLEKLVRFVRRAAAVASATRATVLSDGWRDGSRELLAAVPAGFDDADWARIIGRLPKSEVGDHHMSEILPKCNGEKSLLEVLEVLSQRSNDVDIANNVLHRLKAHDWDPRSPIPIVRN